MPTLSQIRAWSTEHLIEAAHYWAKTADQWEDVFLQIRNQSHFLVWEGAGGDALRTRTGADLTIVSAKADQLRQAARIARDGAGRIDATQRSVRYAVEDAHNAGFHVAEDLSVTDTRTRRTAAEQAARQAQAETFAADIRQRATQLVGVEHDVAAKITTATAGIASTTFPETPHKPQPHIQAVDLHTFKQDPSLPPPGPPGDPFAGWTDEQMAQVASEIAHGHAWTEHKGDFPPGWAERDLARWIYDTMKDPNTRVGTSIKSGGTALLRDGKVIFINPQDGDYGSVYRPVPRPQDTWRTPEEYFEQNTRALEQLPPPKSLRLPPFNPDEMAPPPQPQPAPRVEPPSVARPPVEPPPVEPPAPRPAPPGGGIGGGGGGMIPGLGIGGLHTPMEEME